MSIFWKGNERSTENSAIETGPQQFAETEDWFCRSGFPWDPQPANPLALVEAARHLLTHGPYPTWAGLVSTIAWSQMHADATWLSHCGSAPSAYVDLAVLPLVDFGALRDAVMFGNEGNTIN